MAEKKQQQLVTIDPEAQKYIRDVTKEYVAEMIGVLVDIARNEKVGARDRSKAACRVIEYHSRGTAIADESETGKGSTVVVVATGPSGVTAREMDEASDELSRLMQATTASKN